MGPQLYRCGNVRHGEKHKVPQLVASMGPQLYRCGNAASLAAATQADPCFNGAATLSLRKQFYQHLPWLASTSFNGAATLSLRKPVRDPFLFGVLLELQWGRNFIVAETLNNSLQKQINELASMGPQLYRCGNGPLCMAL